MRMCKWHAFFLHLGEQQAGWDLRLLAGPQLEAIMALYSCTDDTHIFHRARDDTHVRSSCMTLNPTEHEHNLKYLINVLPARAVC